MGNITDTVSYCVHENLAQGRDQRPPKHEEVADVLDLREGGLQALADYVLAESLQALAGQASIQLRHTRTLTLNPVVFIYIYP
jgi:hypothetical protein